MVDASVIVLSVARNAAASSRARWRRVGAAIVAVEALPVLLQAERRPIDTEKSTLTVFVYKSGLFSALADDHVIDAPLAAGTIDETPGPWLSGAHRRDARAGSIWRPASAPTCKRGWRGLRLLDAVASPRRV